MEVCDVRVQFSCYCYHEMAAVGNVMTAFHMRWGDCRDQCMVRFMAYRWAFLYSECCGSIVYYLYIIYDYIIYHYILPLVHHCLMRRRNLIVNYNLHGIFPLQSLLNRGGTQMGDRQSWHLYDHHHISVFGSKVTVSICTTG